MTIIDQFVASNLQKYRMYNMIMTRRFLSKRLGQIITDQIISQMMSVPKEAYEGFRGMRGQKSIGEIFENFILKYLWT